MKSLYKAIGWRVALALPIVAALTAGLPHKGSAETCTFSNILVNSCRPLFLDNSAGYPQAASDFKSQQLYFEKRLGRMSDVVRQFVAPGNYALTSDMVYFATRAPGKSFLNIGWKPAPKWAEAAGGDAAINADIDKMAESIKSVAPNKIFLSLHHEPENDVTSGAAGCPTSNFYKGSYGTPADYVNMWHNVRARFNAKGVTNVVWVWNLSGYSKWQCMINDMYPGDKYVDWIGWDTYGWPGLDWPAHPLQVYNYLLANSNSSRDYKSHPWGTFESNTMSDPAATHQEYANMKTTLDNNSMPLLKLYSIWDNNVNGTDYRIGYDHLTSAPDSGGQPAFNDFANDAKIK